jgi:hypothetical protein
MKVTAYIQFSDNPKQNLIDLEVVDFKIFGKLGVIAFFTSTPVKSIEHLLQGVNEEGHSQYDFRIEEVVDFICKDSVKETIVKPLSLPSVTPEQPAEVVAAKKEKDSPTVEEALEALWVSGDITTRQKNAIQETANRRGLLGNWNVFLERMKRFEWLNSKGISKDTMDNCILFLYKKYKITLQD